MRKTFIIILSAVPARAAARAKNSDTFFEKPLDKPQEILYNCIR